MTRIGVLSDTHGYITPAMLEHFGQCDELWHAGDIGTLSVLDALVSTGKTVRAVFGNIDGREIQQETAEDLWFVIEGLKVFMTHIAGYPGRYNKRVLDLIRANRPDIVVCGHSHILRIIYDKTNQHLHINPGACGRQGLHKVRTMVRFAIDKGNIRDMEIVELGSRGQIQ